MHEDHAFKPPGSVLAGERLENPSRLRAKLCLFLLLAGFAAVAVKLVTIQVLDHEFWVNYVDDQRKSAITIYPKRGTIYDRGMTPLATSVVQEVLCVAPPRVTEPRKLAKILSPYAKMPARRILDKIRNSHLYLLYLRRGLDMKTREKIVAMNLDGVEFRSHRIFQHRQPGAGGRRVQIRLAAGGRERPANRHQGQLEKRDRRAYADRQRGARRASRRLDNR